MSQSKPMICVSPTITRQTIVAHANSNYIRCMYTKTPSTYFLHNLYILIRSLVARTLRPIKLNACTCRIMPATCARARCSRITKVIRHLARHASHPQHSSGDSCALTKEKANPKLQMHSSRLLHWRIIHVYPAHNGEPQHRTA